MGVMVYALLWAMQDLDHQPYHSIDNATFSLECSSVYLFSS